MKKIKQITIELIPFFVAMIITTPLHLATSNITGEILSTVVYILILASLFKIRYTKQEFKIFLFGAVCGLIVEGWGKILFVFSCQKFNSTLPVPLCIPIVWGFAFIIMRRIGNLMMKK